MMSWWLTFAKVLRLVNRIKTLLTRHMDTGLYLLLRVLLLDLTDALDGIG